MNTFKITGFVILFMSSLLLNKAAAQKIESYLIKNDSLQVGDTLTYSLTLQTDQQYDKILFPDSSDFGENIEIKSRKRYKISSYKDSISYTLQFFGTEDTMLPNLQVSLINDEDTTTVETAQELITFASALDGDEFKPLKPIFDFALSYWPYLLGLLLLLILGYILYRYLKRETPEPEPQKITPKPTFVNPIRQLDETIQKLRDDRGLTERRDFKTFYSKLGDALRLYIERLHNIPALESTSRELLAELDQNGQLDDRQYQLLKEILREADMVKFAKYNPPLDRAFNKLDEAAEFVDIARERDTEKINTLKNEFTKAQQEPTNEKESLDSNAKTDVNEDLVEADATRDSDIGSTSKPRHDITDGRSGPQSTSQSDEVKEPKPVIIDKNEDSGSKSQKNSDKKSEDV